MVTADKQAGGGLVLNLGCEGQQAKTGGDPFGGPVQVLVGLPERDALGVNR